MRSGILAVMGMMAVGFVGCMDGAAGIDGINGKDGTNGVDGQNGKSFSLSQSTGTILQKSYTTGNPSYSSMFICACASEPIVLSLGVQGSTGFYSNYQITGIAYSAGTDLYGYDGFAGYYALYSDPSKTLLNRNFKIRYTY